MFMTLKCSRGAEGSIKHVDTSGSFNRPREYYSSLACTTCRSKKLGCSREKTGCRRCQSRGEPCVYEPPRNRNKKTQKQSAPPSNREATQSPRDSPSATALALQPMAMPPGSPIPRSVPGASEQIAAVANVSPQHLSEEIAKQSAGIYSSSSESDFLSVDFMPELIDFSDDFFASSLSSGSEASHDSQIEYNGTYRPDTGVVPVNPMQCEPTNTNKKTPGSPMDLVSPAAVSGISRSVSESLQTDDEDNCDCTGTALRLLEEVASAPKQHELQRTERELYFLKTAISEYAALFECTCLRHDSGLAMLLVTVCEKLQLLFEEVSQSTGKQPELSHSKSQSSPGHGERPYAGQDGASFGHHRRDSRPRTNLVMGHYHIDTPEEHFNVLSALILLQLRRLAVLVSKLKRVAEKREWNAHVSLLRTLIHRIKRLASTLQR